MEENKIVYITRNGEKYHTNINCHSIKGRKLIEISLIQAQKQFKTHCKVCDSDNFNFFQNKKYQKNKNYFQSKNKKFYDKKKNVKNFINSEDADNIIFNSLSNVPNDEQNKVSNIIINSRDVSNEDKNDNIIDKFEEKKNISNDSNDIIYSNKNDENKNNKISFNNANNRSNEIKKNLLKNNSFNDIESSQHKLIEHNNVIKNIYKEKNVRNIDNINIINSINNKKNIYLSCNKNIIENEKFAYDEKDDSEDIIQENIINDKRKDDAINFNADFPNKNFPNNNKNNIPRYQSQQNNLNNNNIICNNSNYKLCGKNDMFLLEETLYTSNLFSFEKINALKEANSNGFIKNGNFRFNFQIIQLKEDNNIPIELEVGFEIKYINYQDMNLIIDEHLINKENIGFKIGSLYDSLIMKKHFIVFKNTGVINLLINCSKGKLFIIGENELNKRKQNIFLDKSNTEIFFFKNFYPIPSIYIKNVKPIFNYDKQILNYVQIKINDKEIK